MGSLLSTIIGRIDNRVSVLVDESGECYIKYSKFKGGCVSEIFGKKAPRYIKRVEDFSVKPDDKRVVFYFKSKPEDLMDICETMIENGVMKRKEGINLDTLEADMNDALAEACAENLKEEN